jgi:hypothetical protein
MASRDDANDVIYDDARMRNPKQMCRNPRRQVGSIKELIFKY